MSNGLENHVPSQVLKELEDVKAQIKASEEQQQPAPEQEAIQSAPEVNTEEIVQDQGIQDVELQQQEQEPQQQSQEVPEVKQEPEKKEINWEQKFNVLNGKYLAEVPRLNATIKALQQELSALKTQILERPAQTQVAAEQKPVEQQHQVSDWDNLREDLGDEIVDTIKSKFDSQQQILETQQKMFTEQNEASFFATLDSTLPNWETVYNSQEFAEWAQGVDLFAEKTYEQILQQARDTHDPHKAALVLNQFMTSNPGTPQQQAPKPKASINSQITPKSVSTGKVPAQPQKLTESQMTELMTSITKGDLPHKEVMEIKNKVSHAHRNGLIIPG